MRPSRRRSSIGAKSSDWRSSARPSLTSSSEAAKVAVKVARHDERAESGGAGAQPELSDEAIAMLTVQDALQKMLDQAGVMSSVRWCLADSSGSVLAETLVTPHDSPPFDKSMMDGFVVKSEVVRGARLLASAITPPVARLLSRSCSNGVPVRSLNASVNCLHTRQPEAGTRTAHRRAAAAQSCQQAQLRPCAGSTLWRKVQFSSATASA